MFFAFGRGSPGGGTSTTQQADRRKNGGHNRSLPTQDDPALQNRSRNTEIACADCQGSKALGVFSHKREQKETSNSRSPAHCHSKGSGIVEFANDSVAWLALRRSPPTLFCHSSRSGKIFPFAALSAAMERADTCGCRRKALGLSYNRSPGGAT